ncbi:MAG: ABC transporter permease subunit [Alphaproteobacteria bacterium]
MRMRLSFSFSVLIIGYIFLYMPILTLVALSFNASPLVTVWGGFSLKWYKSLLANEELFAAVLTSLKIAVMSATLATTVGTLAAIVLVRFGAFRWRTLFQGMTAAPLIMPDVLTGLALLMMFVTLEQMIDWPSERGLITVTIAHTTVAMAYVCLVVQARLRDFDRRFEEAALDLGAKPTTVFFTITLPIIFPSLLTGWLLAFSLSLDDLVIASFLSGPGATTLPMLIFSSIRIGVSPQINALASVIVGLVAISVAIAGIIMHKQQNRR